MSFLFNSFTAVCAVLKTDDSDLSSVFFWIATGIRKKSGFLFSARFAELHVKSNCPAKNKMPSKTYSA